MLVQYALDKWDSFSRSRELPFQQEKSALVGYSLSGTHFVPLIGRKL